MKTFLRFFAQSVTLVAAILFVLISSYQEAWTQVPTKLQILLPGMASAPGTAEGYSGSPSPQTTGGSFTVVINAVNNNWDVIPVSDQVELYSSDPSADFPAQIDLVNGRASVSITLNSGGWQTVSARDLSNPALTDATSPLVHIISLSYFSTSMIGDPFDNVPGQVTAGEVIQDVEISARDAGGSLVNNYNGRVYLFEDTDYGQGRLSPQAVELIDGRWQGPVQFFRAGHKTAQYGVTGDVLLRVTDETPPPDMMEVIINADDEYELWVNEERIDSNGQWDQAHTYIVPIRSGKNVLAVRALNIGSIQNGAGLIVEVRVAGLTVLRSNNNWATDSTEVAGWTGIDFDDSGWGPATELGPYGIAPWGNEIAGFPNSSQARWIWGHPREGYFRASFDVNGPIVPPPAASYHSGQSNRFCVVPEDVSQLLTVMPGETYLPGSRSGRAGIPLSHQGAVEFAVDVYATDAYWNQILSINHTISLSSSDGNAVLQAFGVMNAGRVTMTAEFNTGGAQTLTATDDSDGSILPHTSSAVNVLAERIDHFVFDTISVTPSVPESFAIIITAVDAGDQLVDDFNAVLDLSASTGVETISPSEIQMENGWWSGNVTLTRAGSSVSLYVRDRTENPHMGVSNTFAVNAGPIDKLQILLAGESATPGVAPGKVGAVGDLYAGDSLLVEVRAVDAWWNVISDAADMIRLQGSDSGSNLPADILLSNGVLGYTVALNATGEHFLTAQDQTAGAVKPDTSQAFFVNSGNLSHYVISSIPVSQQAGEPFSVTITAVDAQSNPIASYAGDVSVTSSTGTGTYVPTQVSLSGGEWSGMVTITKAENDANLSVSDALTPQHTGRSNDFDVSPGPLVGLQVLLPGENPTPGLAPGTTGNAVPVAAGQTTLVTISAVDAYWNPLAGMNDNLVIDVSDSFAVLPGSPALANGTTQVGIVFRTADTQSIQVNLAGQPVIATTERSDMRILPNVFSRLLLLMPGESILPGDDETNPLNTPGRSGTPAIQTVGLPFTVTVQAVDDNWNPVVNAPLDQISLSSSDVGVIYQPAENTLVNGRATFSVTFSQGGNQLVRADNLSNTGIVSSPNGVADVLLGGIHYEVVLDTNKVSAGHPFAMRISFKDGVNETITEANHFINISAVLASDLSDYGLPVTSSIALQSGSILINQVFNSVSFIRFKIEDDLGTTPAYSEPVQVLPGPVASIGLSAADVEIRGLAETTVSAFLRDIAGNPVPDQEVTFTVAAGTGEVTETAVTSGSAGMAYVNFVAGSVNETNVISAQVDTVVSTFEVIVNLTPSSTADGQVINYPNPFGAEFESTTIDYYLSEDADVILQIFDLFGNLVWTAEFQAGTAGGLGRNSSSNPNSIAWNGVNGQGQKVGNGGYILIAKAVTNGKVIMHSQRKIAVLR